MTVGLFVPCYVNQFYPNAAKATLELLQKFGVNVVYPVKQASCGQPMANAGFEYLSQDCNKIIVENFSEFDRTGACIRRPLAIVSDSFHHKTKIIHYKIYFKNNDE